VANFTAGTSFSDGVTNDVTAAKLNALVADAVPTANLSLNSTTGTIATFNSTTGTIATLNSTTPTFLGAITASTAVINVGSGQIYKDASGNVGIGTTPNEALNINGSTNLKSAIRLQNQGTDVGFIATEAARIGSGSSNNLSISSFGTNSVILATGTTERLRIDSSGNVGIGTSPSAQLHTKGTGSPSRFYTDGDAVGATLFLQDIGGNGGQILFGTQQGVNSGIKGYIVNGTGPAGSLIFQTRNTSGNVLERMTIDSTGNCSIGTATALSRLHVHGDLTLSNTTTATTAATGGVSVPETAAGFLTVSINGTSRKIPYYA